MKILVVEDDVRKAEAIINVLKADIAGADISLARSYQTGIRAVTEDHPDVVVLDMSLPNYDAAPGKRSGKPRPLGGFEIMRKLRRRGLKSFSIVLTQLDHFGDGGQEYDFAGLEQKCRIEFPGTFISSIYYAQSSSEWKEQLVNTVEALRGESV